MTTTVRPNGTPAGAGQAEASELAEQLARALRQIKDLERELGEVLDRISALESRR